MAAEGNISYIVAFISGFLIFLSPCILPLIPSYIAYLTGISLKEAGAGLSPAERRRIRFLTIMHSLFFMAGFTVVFVLLGATATTVGGLLAKYQVVLKRLGGVLIIFFGLYILGVIKLDFLEKEKQIKYKKHGVSYIGSMLVGMTFAAAWTPCVGPILASILVYAASAENLMQGVRLLSVFSLGLAVPFFLSALAINSFLVYFHKLEKYIRYVTTLGGIFLLLFGVLVLTDRVDKIAAFLLKLSVR